MPSSGARRVSCVRHFAGSAASMVATKLAWTAMLDFSTCAMKVVMAACCSWLRRLRSTSGGSGRPPIMRTAVGMVSASAMFPAARTRAVATPVSCGAGAGASAGGVDSDVAAAGTLTGMEAAAATTGAIRCASPSSGTSR